MNLYKKGWEDSITNFVQYDQDPLCAPTLIYEEEILKNTHIKKSILIW